MEGNRGRNLKRGRMRAKMEIRSLMNIRMPREVSEEMLEAQDAYLQEELEEKGVVSLAEIPAVEEQYGSSHPLAGRISIWQGDITRLKTELSSMPPIRSFWDALYPVTGVLIMPFTALPACSSGKNAAVLWKEGGCGMETDTRSRQERLP